MANISTVHLRIFFTPESGGRRLDTRQIVNTVFDGDIGYGDTYCVPVWIGYGDHLRWIDVTYGTKWGPGEAEALLERHGDQIDAVFTRWFDAGTGYDQILAQGMVAEASRPCRYAFDTVEVVAACGSLPDVDMQIVEVDPGVHVVQVPGTYIGANPRDHWWNQELFRIEPVLDCATCHEPMSVLPEALSAWLVEAREVAEQLRFRHEGRLVRLATRGSTPQGSETGWLYFPADGWANCADEEYQSYAEVALNIS